MDRWSFNISTSKSAGQVAFYLVHVTTNGVRASLRDPLFITSICNKWHLERRKQLEPLTFCSPCATTWIWYCEHETIFGLAYVRASALSFICFVTNGVSLIYIHNILTVITWKGEIRSKCPSDFPSAKLGFTCLFTNLSGDFYKPPGSLRIYIH